MLGIIIVLLFISFLLAYIFIKLCCKDKDSTSILLIGIEITIVGLVFVVFGNIGSFGNDGLIYGFIGLIIVIFGLFVSIIGFRKN